MTDWQKTDRTWEPTEKSLRDYVENPLWDDLCAAIEADYGVKPLIVFSGCSMLPGWNVKYKKSGRSLCTLYPDKGAFPPLWLSANGNARKWNCSSPTSASICRSFTAKRKSPWASGG